MRSLMKVAVLEAIMFLSTIAFMLYCSINWYSSALSRAGTVEVIASLMIFESFLCCATLSMDLYSATFSSCSVRIAR